MNILVVVAHSDDQILGVGGTIARYLDQGHTVKTIICTDGELTHPHFKKEVIKDIRRKESEKADEFLGGDGVLFMGLSEGKLISLLKKKTPPPFLADMLSSFKPDLIFTHALDEAHPEHIAVAQYVLSTYDSAPASLKKKLAVYSFGVWRLVKWKQRNTPRMVVDISSYFTKKIQAIRLFKSQKLAMFTLIASVYIKAITSGFRYQKNFVEVFYKLR